MGKGIVSVKVRNGDINRALKKFKRGVIESGHIFELKDRQQYTKPTTKRRRQKQEAIRKQQFDLLREERDETPRKKKKKRK
jgi:small subunit ribosomal protein S21